MKRWACITGAGLCYYFLQFSGEMGRGVPDAWCNGQAEPMAPGCRHDLRAFLTILGMK
jgi:hypothetical protein